MLQQTRVEAVRPRYERVPRGAAGPCARWPRCRRRRCSKLWEGLGYYSAGAQPAQGGAGDRWQRRGLSAHGRGRCWTLPGFGRVHGRGRGLDRLWRARGGGGWERAARLGAPGRGGGRTCAALPRGARARRSVLAAMPPDADPGDVQPGADGAGGAGLHAAGAKVRRPARSLPGAARARRGWKLYCPCARPRRRGRWRPLTSI